MNEQNEPKKIWISPEIETLPVGETAQILDPPDGGRQEFPEDS